MKNLPRLDEVFVVSEAAKVLRPEFEKIVRKYAQKAQQVETSATGYLGMEEWQDMFRQFAHELEAAEGEDPAELDPGGPKPGTTGKK